MTRAAAKAKLALWELGHRKSRIPTTKEAPQWMKDNVPQTATVLELGGGAGSGPGCTSTTRGGR